MCKTNRQPIIRGRRRQICKSQVVGLIYKGSSKAQVEDAVWLFLRPKMVRVRLLSRDFFSELSFFVERPERTERESEVLAVSSLYLSL